MSVTNRIKLNSGSFSTKQAILGRFITDHLQEVAFMNSTQICQHVEVSEATLTRFVYALGYENFAVFREELRKEFMELNSPEHPDEASPYLSESTAYQEVFDVEIELMKQTRDQIDPATFDRCTDLLYNSREVLLVGGPTHTFLAQYMYNYLYLFRDRVRVVSDLDLSLLGTIQNISSSSVALIFSYPRYPRETQRIVRLLKSNNVPLIGMTDSPLSPIAPFMDYNLYTPLKFLLLTDPLASAMAMIHSLLIGIFKKNPADIRERLNHYEDSVVTANMFVMNDYDFSMKL
jgi:DNA-binding MurR/RpiR family transcriptional regulator